jgi:predicted RNA binding protein YcfA (HicA-like mRNA interferase family)
MRNISRKDLVRALIRAGFREHHVRGSHFYLLAPDGRTIVCVPVHGSRPLYPKALAAILRRAGLSEENLRDLL